MIIGCMTVSPGFDNRIGLLASRQASAFAREQVLAAGASDPMIARRLRSGRWTRAHPGVYVLTGSSPSWIQDVWCTWLAVGPRATVTHVGPAAPRRGAGSATADHPDGSARGHARVAGAMVHQIDDLAPMYTSSMNGLPVSRAARAVVEVAATVGERRLGDIVDDVLWRRRASMLQVSACLRQVARPGKPGIAKLARVLDALSDGPVPAGSDLERSMFGALAASGLPTPARQTPLPGRGVAEGLVDASYGDARSSSRRMGDAGTRASATWRRITFVTPRQLASGGRRCASSMSRSWMSPRRSAPRWQMSARSGSSCSTRACDPGPITSGARHVRRLRRGNDERS